MMHGTDLNAARHSQLCDKVFEITPLIRFAGIIDKMGNLVAGGMRLGTEPLENVDDSQKLFVEFALIGEMRKDFDDAFGKAIYSFTEREKLKLASFPLDDKYTLRVSIEKEETGQMKIIESILKIIHEELPN
jgi:hypothetical protein